ncbi:hypothetical protein K3495_g11053 [Podosphaera aphanis]|nr:hypothetical protein K3495_g11053 [Podosphaera aphanis]
MNKTAENVKPDDDLFTNSIPESPTKSVVQNLATNILQYLSTASTETLAGLALVLAVLVYLILGNVGSIIIGIVIGAALHATWEHRNSTNDLQKRTETSLDISKRLLEFREKVHNIEESYNIEDSISNGIFESKKPETMAAIRELVDAIIKDYVDWWYQPILPKDTLFPAVAHRTLSRFLLSIACHLSKKRAVDSFLDLLTNSTSIIIVFLNEISTALTQSPGPIVDAIRLYLSANPESSLANILDEGHQAIKLRLITTDFLQNFLEKTTYDCDPARIFLNEIFGGVILDMTLKTCSQPEWINQLIVQLLEMGESNLSQAIDVGVSRENRQMDSIVDDFNGNYVNASLKKSSAPVIELSKDNPKKQNHSTMAFEAMDEAAEEVKRLSNLIAKEDAKKSALQQKNNDTNDNEIETSYQREYKRPVLDRLDSSKEQLCPQGSSISPIASHPNSSFTSFDQLSSNSIPAVSRESSPSSDRKINYPTLHNANIIVYDDSPNIERGRLLNKTNVNYLIQIEPASSDYPGWMIVRRYPDFEILHEILRRIAQVSGITAFTEQHVNLPSRKEHTKGYLKSELERYLSDACCYQALADSEGMKRFLKKDDEQPVSAPGQKNGFPGLGWTTPSAFETMGKGVLDVLSQAPKGVAEGGKAISGVFNNIGNLGHRKSNSNVTNQTEIQAPSRHSGTTLPKVDSMSSINSSRGHRASEDYTRLSSIEETKSTKISSVEQKSNLRTSMGDESHHERRFSRSTSSSISSRRSVSLSSEGAIKAPSRRGTPDCPPPPNEIGLFNLPPPPSMIQDDYGSHQTPAAVSTHKIRRDLTPLTEAETKVAVELTFAVINEVYTLSSAWNIRRTLLGAAKTYLLRPGNPSLSQIQSVIQDSIIAANTSDIGIAAHLRTLRKSCLPTEEEYKELPTPMSSEEKESLRIKARKLLIERGVPTALMGVMGQAATTEALGRIFDCLQVEELVRGLLFGLLLQCARIVVH